MILGESGEIFPPRGQARRVASAIAKDLPDSAQATVRENVGIEMCGDFGKGKVGRPELRQGQRVYPRGLLRATGGSDEPPVSSQ